MGIEYQALTILTIWLLFAWLPSSIGKAQSFGWDWLRSNRDPSPKPLVPWAARCERAYSNLVHYYPVFAISVILLGIHNNFNFLTAWASVIYVLARFAHYFVYAKGLPMARTTFWAISVVANIVLLIKLLAIF